MAQRATGGHRARSSWLTEGRRAKRDGAEGHRSVTRRPDNKIAYIFEQISKMTIFTNWQHKLKLFITYD